MKARVYKTTIDFDAETLKITDTRYICVETPNSERMHLMNYEYRCYDNAADINAENSSYERDDLWDHLGPCDGTCEETYDFSKDDYDLILNMAKTSAMCGCSRYPMTDEEREQWLRKNEEEYEAWKKSHRGDADNTDS